MTDDYGPDPPKRDDRGVHLDMETGTPIYTRDTTPPAKPPRVLLTAAKAALDAVRNQGEVSRPDGWQISLQAIRRELMELQRYAAYLAAEVSHEIVSLDSEVEPPPGD